VSTVALWYTARATGVISLVLLTIVVALGIACRSGRSAFGLPRFAVALVHRNAALLAVITLVIHITTLLLDSYAKVHVTDLLVPFVGSYRPFWQGLGTVGLELILALVVTGLLRTRMPERLWRGVHWLAYVCWPVAFAHGLGNGTDSGAGWMRAIAGCSALVVVAAVGWRLAPHFTEHSKVRRPLTRASAPALGRTR
jgi:methionine sulfoxide reductase heme-binding subunit